MPPALQIEPIGSLTGPNARGPFHRTERFDASGRRSGERGRGGEGTAVRIGICYNIDYHPEVHGNPSEYFETILRQVERLDELGYDTVWFSEHHCAAYSFGNPCVMAAAAAQRTKRIRIGTGVSLAPLQHPIFLAEQYGMLDVLSNGRLEYGVGRGYLLQEYDWLKIPLEESHGRYHEAVEFIIKAWTASGPITYQGKHFQVDGYTYFPAPVQKPFPPIYASAAGTQDSFVWAARNGLNLGTALFLPNVQPIIDGISLYRRTLAECGYDPATREVCGITQMYCAPSKAEAVRDGGAFATNYYRFFFDLNKQARKGVVPEAFSEIRGEDLDRANRVLLGDPEDLIGRIEIMRETFGLDLLLLEVAQGQAPPAKVSQALELFGREVLPHVQGRRRAAAAAN
jgi:alkanesulfonate monooxygenase SsuD/methylene tetrahydromethanopterin reductase-like flavin-dependent oxidoreductase (luciferase family)